jgi:NADH:ubiquinone oxidoreductase subunit C
VTPDPTNWSRRVRAVFGDALAKEAAVDDGFGPVTVDVSVGRWVEAVAVARDGLDCTFFDFLSAADELGDGFRVVCHLADHRPGGVEHLVLRTLVPREEPVVPSVVHVFAGARWHERETHEMFGVEFADAEGERLELERLLLPENFEGHPLRKDFVLASRVAKPWPGAKEPGESDHQGGSPSRRRTRPPGVPEPEQWGPREPGTDRPDTLAAAAGPASPRPRRNARATPPRGAASPRDRAGSGESLAGGAATAEDATDMSKATGQSGQDAQTSPPQPGGEAGQPPGGDRDA